MEKNNKKYEKIFDKILTTPPSNPLITMIILKVQKGSCSQIWDQINTILLAIKTNDIKSLKKECYNGFPDDNACLRALVWKYNLKYLSKDITKWEKILNMKRQEYKEIKNAFLLRLKEEYKIFDELENSDENKKDKLQKLSEDTDRRLLETINKDINRTHAQFDFFSKPVFDDSEMKNEDLLNLIQLKKNFTYNNFKEIYGKGNNFLKYNKNETHADVIERILYIYSKLNKDVNYVQGMNELIAPIYFSFFRDNNELEEKKIDIENIEEDSFWCFSNLIGEIKNIFIKEKDNEEGGIFNIINKFEKLIESYDIELYNLFKNNNVSFIHISFRWFSLFFSQDFLMPDTLRLWDIFFCEENKLYFVYYFSLGLLIYKKNKLMNKDFFGIVKELQNLEDVDIEKVIEIGIKIKKEHGKKLDEIIYNNNIQKHKFSLIKKITNTFKKANQNIKQTKRHSTIIQSKKSKK